jgi:hypothetical protein
MHGLETDAHCSECAQNHRARAYTLYYVKLILNHYLGSQLNRRKCKIVPSLCKNCRKMFRRETGDISTQKLCCMSRNLFAGCEACFNDGESSNKCTANKKKPVSKFPRYAGFVCTNLL